MKAALNKNFFRNLYSLKFAVMFLCTVSQVTFGQSGNAHQLLRHQIDSLKTATKVESNDSVNLSITLDACRKLFVLSEFYEAKDLLFGWLNKIETNPENIFYRKSRSAVLNYIGSVHFQMFDHDSARVYYNAALKIDEELQNLSGIANVSNNLGLILEQQGELDLAMEYYLRSLAIKETIQDKHGISNGYNNVGNVYLARSEYGKALSYYQQSYDLKMAIGKPVGAISTMNNMAFIYLRSGDYVKAMECADQSINLVESTGNRPMLMNVFNLKGNIFKERKDFERALENFRLSHNVATEFDNKGGIALAAGNLAIVYSDLAEFEPDLVVKDSLYRRAVELANEAIRIDEEIGRVKEWSSNLTALAIAHYYLNNEQEAISAAVKSLELSTPFSLSNEMKSAIELLLHIYESHGHADSSRHYSSMLRQAVISDLDKNYFLFSEAEKERFFSTLEDDFGLYLRVATKFSEQIPAMLDTACNMSILTKGLSLNSTSSMRRHILNSGDGELIEKYHHWLSLKKLLLSISENDSAYKKISSEANEIERHLAEESSQLSAFEKIRNLEWKDVQSALTSNECAIEFVHFPMSSDTSTEIAYAAFIIRPGDTNPVFVKLFGEMELEKLLDLSNSNLAEQQNELYGTNKKINDELYHMVWQPMEPHLKSVDVVSFCPSGLLHRISFAAITNNEGVRLADLFDLRQVGSVGNFSHPNDSRLERDEKFFLLGSADYGTDSTDRSIWEYLPGSATETEEISAELKARDYNVMFYSGASAREDSAKKYLPSSEIAHISTHGFFFPDPDVLREEIKSQVANNEKDPVFRGASEYANLSFVRNKNPLMRSGLVLADANKVWSRNALTSGEDGIITAQEVSHLDLSNTKLVVLSACETGLGDIKGSEGVYGLQRAFKMAGVKYIIMSLWQVPDKETAEFMTTFYKNLTKMNDIRKAFNAAQKMMREKYDPYYWAAFVLVE